MKLFARERCKRCKVLPDMRFCMRIAKGLCRDCCNEMRVDGKCPEACAYRVRPAENGLNLSAKVDSFTEYLDLLKKTLVHWGNQPSPLFDGQIPAALAETPEGRTRLHGFFSQYSLPVGFPSEWLAERWNLPPLPPSPEVPTPESLALDFVHRIAEDDWQGAADCYRDQDPDIRTYRQDNLSGDKSLRKAETFDILSSGLSERRDTGFVQLDVNHRDSLTLVCRLVEGEWRIVQRIWGAPDLIAGEKESWKPVAVHLSKRELGDAHDLLKKQTRTFPDSADTFYYLGLYSFLSNHPEEAIERFQAAVWLDPQFHEARYNLAAIRQVTGAFNEAEADYLRLLEVNPEDVRCLNNLASIRIAEGRHDDARKLLDCCLALQPDFEMARKNLERIDSPDSP